MVSSSSPSSTAGLRLAVAGAFMIAVAPSALAQAPLSLQPAAPSAQGFQKAPAPKAAAPAPAAPVKAAKPAPARQPPAEPQPAEAAAPAEPQAGEQAQAEPQGNWAKFCFEEPTAKKTLCVTSYEVRSPNGQVVASANLRELVGENKRELVVAVPVGVKLKQGLKLQIDKGKAVPLTFDVCSLQGCYATAEVSNDLLNQFKKGSRLTLAAVMAPNRGFQIPVALGSFKQAFEGQGADYRKVSEERKKLEEGLQKRAQEAGQRLLQAQQ